MADVSCDFEEGSCCLFAAASSASSSFLKTRGFVRLVNSSLEGTRNIHPCSLEWKSGQPCQLSFSRRGAKRVRIVISTVPGGRSLLGAVRSQYHFGQMTRGSLAFLTFFARGADQ